MTKEDYIRMRLYGPSGLEEILSLWLYREGIHRAPLSWEASALYTAIGLDIIAFVRAIMRKLS